MNLSQIRTEVGCREQTDLSNGESDSVSSSSNEASDKWTSGATRPECVMKKSKLSEAQIVAILQEGAAGAPIVELLRK